VLGAGSWGTALAIQLARSGRATRLWGRNRSHLDVLAQSRVNARYLPGGAFPESLSVVPDLAAAVQDAVDVLIVVPSQSFRALLQDVAPHLTEHMRLAWATKGLEVETGKLPHQVAREVLGPQRAMAVLSGPTFARGLAPASPRR
jgi:glycerol-3-phosphate dehydrogenase (NAD(P)+)